MPDLGTLTWSREQVADALGVTVTGFARRRARLLAAGFPPELPGLRGRYDPLAVQGWLARLRGDTRPAPDADPEQATLEAQRAEMRRRATTLAAGAPTH